MSDTKNEAILCCCLKSTLSIKNTLYDVYLVRSEKNTLVYDDFSVENNYFYTK